MPTIKLFDIEAEELLLKSMIHGICFDEIYFNAEIEFFYNKTSEHEGRSPVIVEIIKLIKELRDTLHDTPTPDVIRRNYSDWLEQHAPEESYKRLAYVDKQITTAQPTEVATKDAIQRLQKCYDNRMASDTLEECVQLFEEGGGADAMTHMRESVARRSRSHRSNFKISDYKDNYLQRKRIQLDAQAGVSGMQRIPYGIRGLDMATGGAGRGEVVYIVASSGKGKCITGDTLVSTSKGMMYIKDMQPFVGVPTPNTFYDCDYDVYGFDKKIKATKWYYNGLSKIKTIKLSNGIIIKGTLHHRIITSTKTGFGWRTLEQLSSKKQGHWVAINPDGVFPAEDVILPTGKILDKDFAYYLGCLTGDGEACHNLSITNNDKSMLEELKTILQDHDLEAQISSRKNHFILTRCGNNKFKKLIQELSMAKKSHEKTISPYILKSNKDNVVAFLQGLFDTDGYISSSGQELSYATSSEQLSIEVQTLLTKLGIFCSRLKKKTKKRDAFIVKIFKCSFKHFKEEISFRLERKQKLLSEAVELKNKKKLNTNVDVIPVQKHILKRFYKDLKSEGVSLWRDGHYNLYNSWIQNKTRNPSRSKLSKLLKQYKQYSFLESYKIIESMLKYFWSKIEKIRTSYDITYDLYVPETNAFVANNIINHNSLAMQDIVANMILNSGQRVAYFTKEMTYTETEFRYDARMSGIEHPRFFENKLEFGDYQVWEQAVSNFPDNSLKTIEIMRNFSIAEVEKALDTLAWSFKPDVVFLDYVGLMEASSENKRGDGAWRSYEVICREIKDFAKERNLIVIAASQLKTQASEKLEITFDDIFVGRNVLVQNADVVAALLSDEWMRELGRAVLQILKVRGKTPERTRYDLFPDYDRIRIDTGIEVDYHEKPKDYRKDGGVNVLDEHGMPVYSEVA